MVRYAIVIWLTMFTSIAAVATQQWEKATLSGKFTGHYHVSGVGNVGYSFALKKTVTTSGDIWLEVSYDGKVQFRINGYYFHDLGPLTPLSAINVPKKFTTAAWDSIEPKHMVIGHYYLLANAECKHTLILQILDFTYKDLKHVSSGLFWSNYSSTCSCTFQYLLPTAHSMKELNILLTRKSVPPKQPLSSTAQTAGHSSSITNSAPLKKHEKDNLLMCYEQFQVDTKAFIDLPIEKATTKKCDDMLQRAKDLTTQIKDQIMELDSTITGNGAKNASLKERLNKISDLQLRDRAETRISKIKNETGRLKIELNKWTAKLNELQKTEKKLREYRLIIGI